MNRRKKGAGDLGWTLFEAGMLEEAREVLEQAARMDPSDELARNNLRLCKRAISRQEKPGKRRTQKGEPLKARPRVPPRP
jgi:hypothetical protein